MGAKGTKETKETKEAKGANWAERGKGKEKLTRKKFNGVECVQANLTFLGSYLCESWYGFLWSSSLMVDM